MHHSLEKENGVNVALNIHRASQNDNAPIWHMEEELHG